jgi:hypothetical protein
MSTLHRSLVAILLLLSPTVAQAVAHASHSADKGLGLERQACPIDISNSDLIKQQCGNCARKHWFGDFGVRRPMETAALIGNWNRASSLKGTMQGDRHY